MSCPEAYADAKLLAVALKKRYGPRGGIIRIIKTLSKVMHSKLRRLTSSKHEPNRLATDMDIVFLGKRDKIIKKTPIKLITDEREKGVLTRWNHVTAVGMELKVLDTVNKLDRKKAFKPAFSRARQVALQAKLTEPINVKHFCGVEAGSLVRLPFGDVSAQTNRDQDIYMPRTVNQIRLSRGLPPLADKLEEDFMRQEYRLQKNPEAFRQTKIAEFFKPRSQIALEASGGTAAHRNQTPDAKTDCPPILDTITID